MPHGCQICISLDSAPARTRCKASGRCRFQITTSRRARHGLGARCSLVGALKPQRRSSRLDDRKPSSSMRYAEIWQLATHDRVPGTGNSPSRCAVAPSHLIATRLGAAYMYSADLPTLHLAYGYLHNSSLTRSRADDLSSPCTCNEPRIRITRARWRLPARHANTHGGGNAPGEPDMPGQGGTCAYFTAWALSVQCSRCERLRMIV